MLMPDEIDAEVVVARARAEAEAITARAEVEAQAVRSRSEADAQAIRAWARVEADELEARARGDREHAGRLLAEAEERSAQLIAEAESVRRSADDTIERLVGTRRELEAVIEHLVRLPNTVFDLTEHPAGASASLDDPPTALVDVLGADALADLSVVPMGSSVSSRAAGRGSSVGMAEATVDSAIGEGNAVEAGAPTPGADDPVARMVRSAIDRAARAASDPSGQTSGPAGRRAQSGSGSGKGLGALIPTAEALDERETHRSTRDDLG